jgi:hypothetical protein
MSNSDKLKQEILQKLKGFSETVTDSIGEIAKGKSMFVESSVQSTRMAICHACPDFNANTTQCKKCGCFMSAKTRLKASSCPVSKWGKDI